MISVGAFYNPHRAEEILSAGDLIDHLAMADPPRKDDPHFPKVRERFTLLLHDYLGQLSDPLGERQLARARSLAALYDSPWIAEHFQCVMTQDTSYNVDYVFPPLYTREFLERYIENAAALVKHVQRPLVMENIPRYFSIDFDEMSEGTFLRRFFDATGAGLLLDIAHVWLGAYYTGRDVKECLKDLPLEATVEIHIAGVKDYPDLHGPWISPRPPSEEFLELAAFVLDRAPDVGAVTYDAFSTTLEPGWIPESVALIRKRLGL